MTLPYGKISEAAELAGVSRQYLQQCLRGQPISVAQALRLERITGGALKVEDLCPLWKEELKERRTVHRRPLRARQYDELRMELDRIVEAMIRTFPPPGVKLRGRPRKDWERPIELRPKPPEPRKKKRKVAPRPPKPAAPKPPKPLTPKERSERLARALWGAVRTEYPMAKLPDLGRWAKELAALVGVDDATAWQPQATELERWDALERIMEWALNRPSWRRTIINPKIVRARLAEMVTEMMGVANGR